MIDEALARRRYYTIAAVRLAGIAMMLLGITVLAGKIDWPPVAGWLIAANGVIDALIVPILLAKRWRSPKQ